MKTVEKAKREKKADSFLRLLRFFPLRLVNKLLCFRECFLAELSVEAALSAGVLRSLGLLFHSQERERFLCALQLSGGRVDLFDGHSWLAEDRHGGLER